MVNSYINGSALSKNNYHVKKIIEDRLINPFLSYFFFLSLENFLIFKITSMRAAKTVFALIEFAIPNAHKFL